MRPLVPPYYGAPQTEPGVPENTGDKKLIKAFNTIFSKIHVIEDNTRRQVTIQYNLDNYESRIDREIQFTNYCLPMSENCELQNSWMHLNLVLYVYHNTQNNSANRESLAGGTYTMQNLGFRTYIATAEHNLWQIMQMMEEGDKSLNEGKPG